jgi:RNA polymerase sigma-70 factor (ECF subfamily)
MSQEPTTIIVQRYLCALGDGPNRDATIRALLERAVERLRILCGGLLRRSYPRLTRPPLNVDTVEILGGVVERLLRALREVKPETVRQFFALANQHLRWELNALARRLDQEPVAEALPDTLKAADPSDSHVGPDGRRILEEIDRLPEEEREVFELVHLQAFTHAEVAETLGVATKTVQRRLNRALVVLAERLHDVQPN